MKKNTTVAKLPSTEQEKYFAAKNRRREKRAIILDGIKIGIIELGKVWGVIIALFTAAFIVVGLIYCISEVCSRAWSVPQLQAQIDRLDLEQKLVTYTTLEFDNPNLKNQFAAQQATIMNLSNTIARLDRQLNPPPPQIYWITQTFNWTNSLCVSTNAR